MNSIWAFLNAKPSAKKFAFWAGILAVLQVTALVFLTPPGARVFTSNLLQFLSCGLALWACMDARQRATSFGRSFWSVCGLAYLLWMVAQSVWAYREIRYGVEITGQYSFTDVLFFFAFAPFAMLLLTDPSQKERVDWQRTLDVVQVGIVVLCAYLYFFYVPSRWETEEETMKRMVGQVFFGRNLVLTGALWLRTLISTGKRERSLFLTVALCMTTYTALTRVSNYARLHWDIQTGTWFDLGWIVPFLLSALFIANWQETDEPEVESAKQGDKVKRILALHLTPMLMPAFVLWLGAKIAAEQVAVASVAIMASFGCYSLRLWVTQYRQSVATAALARAEERFRTVFSSNPQPSWVYDQDTLRFLEVNEAAVQQYGYTREEFLKMTVTEIRPAKEVERFLERQPTTGPYSGGWQHESKDGRIFEVQVIAQPLELAGRACTLVIAVDVTERLKLEEQVRHAQKMEAVGTLAGGIAHDFNNVLTIITGYSQVVLEREKVRHDPQLGREMRQIENAAQRAAGLVRQLLTFSSRQVIQPQVMELGPVITGVQNMLEPLLGGQVEVVTSTGAKVGAKVGTIYADPGQIEQVLVNLAFNAKDAMGPNPPAGSRLAFLTENVKVSPERAQVLGVEAGRYVLLTVSDTGCGMEKSVQARIFEPFYTTKAGGGTGLGLSAVYGIVQQCRGAITVESAPGAGATFRIYLPEAGAEEAEPQREDRARRVGRETILIAEDDAGLRELTTRILTRAGYEVYSAGRHDEAEEIARQHGTSIHLLLTDVVMPEVSGKELADRLTAKYPHMAVLFMSGYTDEMVLKQGVMEGTMHFIPKPFTPASLAQKVREVLDATVSHP